jgi:hypothetical protein
MRQYVTAQKCKRQMILTHFGFEVPNRVDPVHECCDYHPQLCNCDDCVLGSISLIFDPIESEQSETMQLQFKEILLMRITEKS